MFPTDLEVALLVVFSVGCSCWFLCCCGLCFALWRRKQREAPERRLEQRLAALDLCVVREESEEIAAPDGYVWCEGHRWPVSRAALANMSPVFYRIYDSMLVKSSRPEAVVTIEHTEWRICEQMLDYVHIGRATALHGQLQDGGRLTFAERHEQLLKLLALATRYEVRDLQAACLESLVHASKTLVWFAGDADRPMQATSEKGFLLFNCIDANGRNCVAELMHLAIGDPFAFDAGGKKYSGVLVSKPVNRKDGVISFRTDAGYPDSIRVGMFSVDVGSHALSPSLGSELQLALQGGKPPGIVQQKVQSYKALSSILASIPYEDDAPGSQRSTPSARGSNNMLDNSQGALRTKA